MKLILSLVLIFSSAICFAGNERQEQSAPSTTSEIDTNRSPASNQREYQLSYEDRKVLEIGEISTAQYVIGGIIGTYPIGLGVGHAIQGRYLSDGWKFTVGEIGSVMVMMAGATDCMYSAYSDNRSCNMGLIMVGLFGFAGFRIWEIVDVWAAPPEINRRYRFLMQQNSGISRIEPLIIPNNNGPLLGLRLSF